MVIVFVMVMINGILLLIWTLKDFIKGFWTWWIWKKEARIRKKLSKPNLDDKFHAYTISLQMKKGMQGAIQTATV